MNIQWYPGHMAKAKRLLEEQLKKADFIIELCDARIPSSSRNEDLLRLVENKKRVLVLTKADLADPSSTKAWLEYYRQNGEGAIDFDANPKSRKRIVAFLNNASKSFVKRAEDRGIKKTIRAIVLGVPNVGKSTFINRIAGSAITSVADKPGHTKSNRWVKVSEYFELMDSPGMLWPKIDDEKAAMHLAYIGTIKDAVYNTDELAMELIWELLQINEDNTRARYKLKDNSFSDKTELMDAVCKGRGFVAKGGVYDYERACATILDEFRAGKLGRITFEKP
ncbi:MAG: ribosome biogenesis GTPase YlqF [Eubacteriales bacterium]|nr:ribosome biogenesis GTPase YlqF [Eubacteriales bacterium]